MNKTICVDPTNFKSLVSLMDLHEEFPYMLFGENEQGEENIISINRDNVTVSTYQKNGWIRQNVYYRDGSTEESYPEKWED